MLKRNPKFLFQNRIFFLFVSLSRLDDSVADIAETNDLKSTKQQTKCKKFISIYETNKILTKIMTKQVDYEKKRKNDKLEKSSRMKIKFKHTTVLHKNIFLLRYSFQKKIKKIYTSKLLSF